MLIQGLFAPSRIELTQLQGCTPLGYLQGESSEEGRYERSVSASDRESVRRAGPVTDRGCPARARLAESPRGSRSACAWQQS